MVCLRFLSGARAGQTVPLRRLPCSIGRSPENELVLTEDGVWDRHLRLSVVPPQGVWIERESEAWATLNERPFLKSRIRPGDVIGFGAIKVQLGLDETHPYGLRWREWSTWIGLGALGVGQIALIYWLAR
jgi:pSer/pThr/pTyr-binding forkhead associated (FHA) protein